jgi:hypothetical protein
MSSAFVKVHSLIFAGLLLLAQSSDAQSTNTDTLLIRREHVKWEALQTKSFAAHADWFAKDFAAIGYLPDASVYRMGFGDITGLPKMDSLPAAVFVLSGFKVINASADVKVISYRANGPLSLYITAVWANREGEWKTVFYQATKYK